MTIIQLIFVKFEVKFLIMIKWHKKQLDKIMKKFGLNTYQITKSEGRLADLHSPGAD